MRLMVIDDDALSLKVLCKALEISGFDCVPFSDPLHALDELDRRERFHAVLTDLKMPGLSGLDIVRTVRARDRSIPVVVMTAFSEQEQLLFKADLRVDAFFRKPLDIRALTACLREFASDSDAQPTGVDGGWPGAGSN